VNDISLERYFQREIEHINNELKEIKELVRERGLRTFQLEELMRELEIRVHDAEVSLKLYGRIVAALGGMVIAILISWLTRLLGL
jgi:FKBP-type peptidyl-prolyl cis-trans isomerase (trigger factor)